jgi:hypothetical protein
MQMNGFQGLTLLALALISCANAKVRVTPSVFILSSTLASLIADIRS